MYKHLHSKISQLYHAQAPTTGIGLFRLLFGLVTLQEVFFLIYFNHLIFDPIPYMDVEFPMIPFFLYLWAIVATSVAVGYRCQQAIIVNYIFWIVFVSFTPMQRDFDGGFDLFMIGGNLFMMIMPTEKSFSIDALRHKLQTPFKHFSSYPKQEVSRLTYHIPVIICLGFLYFDSAIHKMFAEHWRNGLGAWLPASMPYYVSAINMSWLLDNEVLQKTIGYIILIFQFTFVFLVYNRYLRPLFFLVGAGLHLGITLTLNIYPFGLGMLIFYTLVIPFSWYKSIGIYFTQKGTSLTVFYDEQCPLCAKTVLTINHFDIFKAIDFKGAQSHAARYTALKGIPRATLLTDLYALDNENNIYAGVDTYAQILIEMRYTFIIGYLLKMPAIHTFACRTYRKIADSRTRVTCDKSCDTTIYAKPSPTLYDKVFTPSSATQERRHIHRISKIFTLLLILQINSSIYYGLFYRLDIDTKSTAITALLSKVSNTFIHYSGSFMGITPHALYLHDHFEGYDHLLGITYTDKQGGKEKWLPFVTKEGKLAAPNWGRVHSMWANIAVTPNIDNDRLSKFIMKTTAFWGIDLGLDLETTTFHIKLKKISAPSYWVEHLLASNLSGDWTTIGQAAWQGQTINIDIPDDINAL
ncbi:MAG: DUF393 domain-containing protein [Methylococcales bacterium]|nr:DUF393 domain-containing protein [Methylococcales bacterium]